jgi:hypothetical protein
MPICTADRVQHHRSWSITSRLTLGRQSPGEVQVLTVHKKPGIKEGNPLGRSGDRPGCPASPEDPLALLVSPGVLLQKPAIGSSTITQEYEPGAVQHLRVPQEKQLRADGRAGIPVDDPE